MKVYIATKFENIDGFKQAEKLLNAKGHQVSHDWTKDGLTPEPLRDLAFMGKCANADFDGVFHSDRLIFIPVENPMAGAWVEMGIAIALGIPVIIVDNGLKDCIFYHCRGVYRARTIEGAIELL